MAEEKTNDAKNDQFDDAKSSDVESAPEANVVPAATVPTEKSGVFFPLVLGGAIAALLGFLGSELGLIGSKIGDLPQTVAAQQERIETLENAEQPTFDTSIVDTLREDVDSRISAIDENLTATQTRLTALEERPIIDDDGGLDAQAYVNELTALKTSVEEQRAEIDTLLENARSIEQATAEAAKVASAQAALVRVISALDAGQPYDGPLAEIADAGVEVPEALSAFAADGVATLGSLQDTFPKAAREALAAARSNADDEDKPSGLAAILKQQLGARSITPREGDDPDAVLSRAEASLRAGDLNKTLEEISALPEAAIAVLGDWQSRATAREGAKTAASNLSQSLTTN